MGLGRWWITHGPGSPGSVAKAMANSYRRIKAAYQTASQAGAEIERITGCRLKDPIVSQDELLLATLRCRYSQQEIDDNTANRMVKDSDGHLSQLTLQIIMLEIPAATGAMMNAPQVYTDMIDVVMEVTSKFAPGA